MRYFTGWAGIAAEEAAFEHCLKTQNGSNPVFDNPGRFDRVTARLDALAAPFAHLQAQGFEAGWEFWTAEQAFYPRRVRPGPQDRGNCVGYSAVLAAKDGMCDEVYWGDEVETPFIPLVHFSYGAGRVYVGNNRLGRSDGSLGTWQAEADTQIGLLPHDLPGLPQKPSERCEPDEAEFARWGYTKAILDQWAPKAAPFKVGAFTRLQTGQDVKDTIVNVHRPITIASNQGFRSRGFDQKYGIQLWDFGGSWAHQMHLRACVQIAGDWFVYVGNQWGLDFHGDPGKGPRGGFWIPLELMDRWAPRAVIFARGRFAGRTVEKPDFGVI